MGVTSKTEEKGTLSLVMDGKEPKQVVGDIGNYVVARIDRGGERYYVLAEHKRIRYGESGHLRLFVGSPSKLEEVAVLEDVSGASGEWTVIFRDLDGKTKEYCHRMPGREYGMGMSNFYIRTDTSTLFQSSKTESLVDLITEPMPITKPK